MSSPMRALMTLSPGARLAVLLGSGGAGAAFLYMLYRLVPPMTLFYIIVIGGAVLALLLGGYAWLKKSIRRRKGRQSDEAIAESATSGASDVSDPDEIARIDQLRKDWDAAVRKFRENNDEGLDSLPWYLLVGEPGSGKTEAIRHSGIPFPPGLNQSYQGAGGTLNMDWWFANDAIIIDTAGRLMFSETREWTELLKQLNTHRRHCPINGMLLVIPADSLLKDEAEQIEQKADRISQQITSVKRHLGIRFPVFVVISKSDLVTGFREFFEELRDPDLQHQMLGWSNPGSLDDPFDPEMVDQHIESVCDRLRRRRMAMLLDPPRIEAESDRRIDQVDALYAFPDELANIAPRLRLYLEKIFTPGPWTKKPPFIRGIYFTSSMQEGKEIDTAIAEMLGVQVDELPGGRVWQEDKSYFLRDLFMKKVFPEQGLVTRAANASKQFNRNRWLTAGAGTAVIILSIALVALALRDFRTAIGQQHWWWTDVQRAQESETGGRGALPQVLIDNPHGLGLVVNTDERLRLQQREYTPAQMLERSGEFAAASEEIRPRGLLWPVAALIPRTVSPESVRAAHGAMLERQVLAPLVREAGDTFCGYRPRDWQHEYNDVLVQVLRLARLAHDERAVNEDRLPQIGPLVAFTAAPGSEDAVPAIQNASDAYFRDAPRPLLRTGTNYEMLERVVREGISVWRARWSDDDDAVDPTLAALGDLRAAVEDFSAAEEEILRLERFRVDDEADREQLERLWNEHFDALSDAHERARAAIDKLDMPAGDSLAEFARLAGRSFTQQAASQYEALVEEIPDEARSPIGDRDSTTLALLKRACGDLSDTWRDVERTRFSRVEELVSGIRELDDSYLLAVGRAETAQRLFEKRYAMYHAANGLLTMEAGDVDPLTLALHLERFEAGYTDAERAINRIRAEHAQREHVEEAAAVSKNVLTAARRLRAEHFSREAIRRTPASGEQLAAMIGERASAVEITMPRVAAGFDLSDSARASHRKFHPEEAGGIFRAWSMMHAYVDRDRLRQVEPVYKDYAEKYVEFWTVTVPQLSHPTHHDQWPAFQRALREADVRSINRDLAALCEEVIHALGALTDRDDEHVRRLVDLDRLTDARRRLRQQQDHYSDSGFWEEYGHILDRWTALPQDPDLAGQRLMEESAGSFRRGYLPSEYDQFAVTPSVDFWNGTAHAALDLLAEAAMREAEHARRRLEGTLRAFPLCRDCPPEEGLSIDQVEEAYDAVNRLAAEDDRAGEADDGRTIRHGAWERSGPIREKFNRMRGLAVVEALDREVLEAVRKVAVGIMEAEARLVPGDSQRNRSAIGIYTHVEVSTAPPGGDGAGNGRSGRWERSGNEWQVAETLRVPMREGDSLTVALYRHRTDDEPTDSVRMDGPWSLVEAILAPDAEKLDADARAAADADAADIWLVPLESEQGMRIWMRIVLDRDLPRPQDWPSESRWITRGR